MTHPTCLPIQASDDVLTEFFIMEMERREVQTEEEKEGGVKATDAGAADCAGPRGKAVSDTG